MIRIISLLLACLLLSGCGSAENSPDVSEYTAGSESTVPVSVPSASAQDPVTVQICIPNENADGFLFLDVEIPDRSPKNILSALVEAGVLPAGSQVRSFHQDGKRLTLDLNQVFGDRAAASGTAGEMALIGSVVNTFLTLYDACTLLLTVEGNTLETGHQIYDIPLTLFE